MYKDKGTTPDQPSLPGFDAPAPSPVAKTVARAPRGRASYTLFFAIRPPADVAVTIAQQYAPLGRALGAGAKHLAANRLHITLQELGGYVEVPQRVIDAARAIGDALAASAFVVAFGRAMSYRGSNALVLCGKDGTAELVSFHQRLGLAIEQAGLWVKGGFNPHMTIAYGPQLMPGCAIEPIPWTATEFVLIKSHVGQTVHEVLGRWPLHA